MKRKLKFFGISLAIIVIGAAMIGYGLFMGNREMDRFLSVPTIESQEELEAALEKQSTLYCLTDMPVSSEKAEDPVGILEGDYAYILYVKELCELQKDSSYKWTSSKEDVSYAVSPLIKLYGTFDVTLPEGLSEYNYYIPEAVELNEHNVKSEYLEMIDSNYYYPEKIATLSGNTRYSVYLVPSEITCALYAYVGDGKITLARGESSQNYIVPNGDIATLYNYHGSSRGMLPTIIGMMIVMPFGLLCFVGTLVSTIFNALLGNRKSKKKKK